MEERRKFVRVIVNIYLEEIFDMENYITRGKGFLKDISMLGAGIETHEHFKEGSKVLLSFTLPGNIAIRNIRGVILRVKRETERYIIAIKFTKIGLLNKLRLKKALNIFK